MTTVYTTESGATYTVFEDGWTEYHGSSAPVLFRGHPVAVDRDRLEEAVTDTEFWPSLREQIYEANPVVVGKALFVEDMDNWRLSTDIVSIEEVPSASA